MRLIEFMKTWIGITGKWDPYQTFWTHECRLMDKGEGDKPKAAWSKGITWAVRFFFVRRSEGVTYG